MKIGRKKKWTEDELVVAVKTSRSIAEVLKKLKLFPRGSNYNTVKEYIVLMNLSTEHFDGKPWMTGLRLVKTENLKGISSIKSRLLQDRGTACERCGIKAWYGEQIKLELHHIDGNRYNNKEKNLLLLCPNCHSYTDNWKGKNRKCGLIGKIDW